MLFKVVIASQADHPSVRWFECHSAIGAATDMRAFDGATHATIDAAVMTPDPCSVRRAFTFTGEAPRVLDWEW